MKKNKIKGGIYKGWWTDFYTKQFAKRYGHRQFRRAGKAECRKYKEG